MGMMFENEAELLAEREAERATEAAWDAMVKEAEKDNWRFDNEKVLVAANAARIKREEPVLKEIAALNGGTVKDGRLYVKGVDVSYILDFKEEWTKGWRSKPTGKTSLIVGRYGSRTRFPMRKDGSYNYADIARTLLGYAEGKLAEAARAKALNANEGKVKALRDELGLEEYYSAMKIGPATSKELPYAVSVEFRMVANEETVRKLHAALVELGVIKKGA